AAWRVGGRRSVRLGAGGLRAVRAVNPPENRRGGPRGRGGTDQALPHYVPGGHQAGPDERRRGGRDASGEGGRSRERHGGSEAATERFPPPHRGRQAPRREGAP